MKELPKAYEPQLYEDKIYERWEKSGFFNPDVCIEKGICERDAKHFSIVLPPPNVTGTLHIGHAMMLAIQDVMIRYHRMKGDWTLWLPGTDHAAIATQTKVEKLLIEKGIKEPKKELGREKFLAEVDKFAQESHDTIINQCKKMGSSLDWSREAFTLDEERNLAVRTVFKKMYDDGLIYRGYRIVNWCPHCHSTIADDEVEYKEQKAKFYTFKYSKDFPLTISTTRPETKLGDTAVAVNPKDKRYKKYIGQEFDIKNFAGGADLKIKIIADENVDMEFGTGALGVTPAHSLVDYEMAQNNDLPVIKIIDEDGKMTVEAGRNYVGLSVFEARKKVVENLRDNNLLEKEEEIDNNLSICYRCGTPIEPLPSKQWFIDVNKKFKVKNEKLEDIKDGEEYSLKELMQTVVKSKQIEIIPERFDKIYFHWIDNLRDWCISRQLWYGHQIPVWYKKANKGIQITLIRHGESEANMKELGTGHMDSPLTEKGKQTAIDLGKEINSKDYDFVFSSDLSRAVETASLIFGDYHKNIIIDKRLREIDLGDVTGKGKDDVNKYRLIGYPNGENYNNVRDRMIDFLSEMIDKYDGKKIAIVGHSGSWRVLENIINGISFDIEHLTAKVERKPIKYTLTELIYSGVGAPNDEGWTQDPDTLDTWFSSGLWTFSTLGYPDLDAEDLKNFHPTSVMETGYDILFFWVARMILMTTYVMGDIPFEKVYLHGLVRDEQGRKMSKSLGNVIDPLDVCKKYGTDAVRLSLLLGNSPGSDSKLSEEKIAGFRNFSNKLWNMSRFMLLNIPEAKIDIEEPKAKTLADKWILGKFIRTILDIERSIEKFDFSFAGEQLRDFTWTYLADWYLEIAKIEGNKSEILNYILNTILKLWHPFMPFVTEQIWSEIYGEERVLMVERFPYNSGKNEMWSEDSLFFEKIKNIISRIRNVRAENKIEPAKKLNVSISAGDKVDLFKENAGVIKGLARLEELTIDEKVEKPDTAVGFVESGVEVFINLSGAVDIESEKVRLQKEIDTVEPYVQGLEKKLSNAEFVNNAPEKVVMIEKNKLTEAQEKLAKLKNQLSNLN